MSMAIFENLSEVFDLAGKEFYTPLFSEGKKRKHKPKSQLLERRVAQYRQPLQRLRRLAGIRQQTMASAMNTTQSVVSRFESGWGNPTIGFLNRYCEVLDIEIGIVFKDELKK